MNPLFGVRLLSDEVRRLDIGDLFKVRTNQIIGAEQSRTLEATAEIVSVDSSERTIEVEDTEKVLRIDSEQNSQ